MMFLKFYYFNLRDSRMWGGLILSPGCQLFMNQLLFLYRFEEIVTSSIPTRISNLDHRYI